MTQRGRQGPQKRRKWRDESFVLFVEGYSDLVFYAEFLEHVGLFEQCFIQDIGGKDNLPAETLLLLRPDNLRQMSTVGVILDADNDPDGAFSLARRSIQKAVGYDIPKSHEWFKEPDTNRRFGVAIVPSKAGELETLAWDAWKSEAKNSKLRECVENFIDCSSKTGLSLRSLDKVKIAAALSILNEEDPRLGAGARAKLFNFDSPQFKPIYDFFHGLKS